MELPGGQIITLAEDSLYALMHPYAVDANVSWHSPQHSGAATMNCYLLKEGNDALLVDTGLTVHEQGLVGQLDQLLGGGQRLSIFNLRQGEFDSICNVMPICNRFQVDTIYGVFDGGYLWTNFRPEHAKDAAFDAAAFESIETVAVGREGTIKIGAAGHRSAHAFFPPLRLLNTYWIYDDATKTLLTSDMFSYVISPDGMGPWLVEAENDLATIDDMGQHMLDTRYWWLPIADTDAIRAMLDSVFSRWEVETIAPAYGAILRGKGVVERHVEMLDRLLASEGVKAHG